MIFLTDARFPPPKNAVETEFNALVAELREFEREYAKEARDKAAIEPCEFEKDRDWNFHVDFVSAAANLRAWNYRLKPTPKHEVKMIAGKIIPALATTTASVCGLVMVEMLKLVQGKANVADFKDSSNSLAVNAYFFSEPVAPVKAKVSGGPQIVFDCANMKEERSLTPPPPSLLGRLRPDRDGRGQVPPSRLHEMGQDADIVPQV